MPSTAAAAAVVRILRRGYFRCFSLVVASRFELCDRPIVFPRAHGCRRLARRTPRPDRAASVTWTPENRLPRPPTVARQTSQARRVSIFLCVVPFAVRHKWRARAVPWSWPRIRAVLLGEIGPRDDGERSRSVTVSVQSKRRNRNDECAYCYCCCCCCVDCLHNVNDIARLKRVRFVLTSWQVVCARENVCWMYLLF